MKYPHFTNRIFLLAPLVALHSSLVQVKTLAFCLSALSSSGLCFVCFAHRHSWILQVQCFRLAYCDGSTRIGKSLCVHTTPTHCIARDTPWFCGYSRHAPFTQAGHDRERSVGRRCNRERSLATTRPAGHDAVVRHAAGAPGRLSEARVGTRWL